METLKRLFKMAMPVIVSAFLVISFIRPAQAGLVLTSEEQAYIDREMTFRAASIHGVAPLHYINAKGEITGINVRILQEIADLTGLNFTFELYDSAAETVESGADILFSITRHYAPPEMILSRPYLKSETVLYINAALDPTQLDDKIYAGLKGGTLPEGVKKENTVYYGTREGSLDAVETGAADYGYGNAYSVAYYTLQNNYKNIITIPKGKESRAYSIGFLNEDELLISIINKAIDALDEQHIHTLVLDVAAHVDRKITFPMVLEAHGGKIFGLSSLIVAVLLLAITLNIRANNALKLQNRRHELLSHISNECLFEYHFKPERLELSGKSKALFGVREQSAEMVTLLTKTLLKATLADDITVRLPVASGETGVFKVVASNMYDDHGKLNSIVGKLIDVTAEEAEKQALITLSQTDGLTGLYNVSTTRQLITDRINSRDRQKQDALILIDCDDLKVTNDQFGHLAGDQALKTISTALEATFRESDIIGRIGGDEFCVYVENIPSVDSIRFKCRQLNTTIRKSGQKPPVSVSAGIAFLTDEETYEDLFKKADEALYQSKNIGKNRVVIHGETQITG